MNDNPSDLAVEIVEAIQCDIPDKLIADVLGVSADTISDWINDRATMTPKQRKIFRAVFGPIYGEGIEYNARSDDPGILGRANKAYKKYK